MESERENETSCTYSVCLNVRRKALTVKRGRRLKRTTWPPDLRAMRTPCSVIDQET